MLASLIFTSNITNCASEKELPLFGGESTIEQISTCADPTDDYWNNMREVSSDWGLDLELPGWNTHHECNIIPGGVVAQDLNMDGWDDLLFLNHEGSAWVYQNVNGESVQSIDIDRALFVDRPALSLGAMDFTGDGLPDLVQTGVGYLAISENLGDFEFGNWDVIINESGFPYSCFGSFSAGDIDQDGDLDIVLAGTDLAVAEGIYPGTEYPEVIGAPTLLLENTSVGWEVVRELSPWEDVAELSVLQILSDYDNDGDLDIISSTDRSDGIHYPPMALWQNERNFTLEDVAPELGIDLPISGMGLGSNDLNGDGFLDYCISDVSNHLICLMSMQDGFYLGGESLGLDVEPDTLPNVPTEWTTEDITGTVIWSGWSIIMQDLDNNGLLDIAVTGGNPPDYGSVEHSDIIAWQPDWLWIGTNEGFKDLDVNHPFLNPRGMYGMAGVDLNKDGHLELIKSPANGRIEIWTSDCTTNNWIEIDLLGFDMNAEAFGAKVFTHFGDSVDIQEVHGLLTMGQSPSRIHVGLGSTKSVEKIEVWWPDGARSTHPNPEVNRRIRLRHPDL